MNPGHGEGWPPGPSQDQGSPSDPRNQPPRQYQSYGPAPAHQQGQQSQSPAGAPVLPHPGSLYPSSNSALPALSSLPHNQPPHNTVPQPPQQLPGMHPGPGSVEQAGPYRHQHPGEGDRGHAMQDPRVMETHRDPDIRMRDADMEREVQDRHSRIEAAPGPAQAPPHENNTATVPLHQPVAVAPVRAIHGPNGLLGGGAVSAVNGQNSMGPQGGPLNVFAGQHAGQPDAGRNPQMQPPTQQAPFQQPFGSGGSVAPVNAPQQGQQPILNDALSYLDQVKVQFSDKADVYNKFLDIMKDFKGGVIDTPGVIDRVSNLFAGNPSLIQGFNTFLPPGYRIECGTGENPNAIRVTTPMGTTTSQLPSRPLSNPMPVALGPNGYYDGDSRNPNTSWQSRAGPNNSDVGFGGDRRSASGGYGASLVQGLSTAAAQDPQRLQQNSGIVRDMLQQDQRGVSQLQDAASVVGAGQGLLPQGLQGGSIEKRGPVEFNHAINYVNKIKNRFATQPDIYKQFLEILQTYQRESKPIQEVYAQVTHLFQSAPDLLNDFKQFLPESTAPSARDEFPLSNLRGDPAHLASAPAQMHTPRNDTSRMPPVGNFAPTPNTGKEHKRKRPEKASAQAPVADAAQPAAGRTAYNAPGHANKRPKYQHAVKPVTAAVQDVQPLSPTLVPALPTPLPPLTTTTATQDDFHFFDRAKKTINSKAGMNEFLKLLNLYAEGLADRNVVYSRAHQFLGTNPELMTQLAGLIGYKDRDVVVENRPRNDLGRVALTQCRSHGPSYRLLPKAETQALCGGRDELCKSVLNDDWASHPTWASEDSGFVAHRKNTHEEGLHRIEEERHDYDFNIEACSRTVQLLENVCQQLYNAPPADREHFELPDTLGGESKTIYKRVIMKVYGREHGLTVVEHMFKNPYQVLPVVYSRVKSRLEEWKAAQREWEKVWREQTQKIFWRSLDHQSSNAKNADKRQFQAKTLRDEIVSKHAEMQDKRLRGTAMDKKYQFRYNIDDQDVLYDAARLVLAWAVTNLGDPTATAFEDFLKDFFTTFFSLERTKVDTAIVIEDYVPSSDEADGNTPGDSDSGVRKVNGRGSSLRKDLLDPRGRKGNLASRHESVASGSRASTPGVASGVEEDAAASSAMDVEVAAEAPAIEDIPERTETWLNIVSDGTDPTAEHDPDEKMTRSQYIMYCDQNIYSFLRMFLMLYERLLNLKKSEESVREQIKKAMAPKPAIDMNMIDKFPTDFFNDVSEHANYYEQLLHLIQDVLREAGDIGQVEEVLRRYYLDCGWQLYSFDKLVSSLARFGQTIKSGPESKDSSMPIWQAFKKERLKPLYSYNELVAYRHSAGRLISSISKDSDTFKFVWDSNPDDASSKVYISLVRPDDPTINLSDLDKMKLWHAYQATFHNVAPSEGVPMSSIQLPFVATHLEMASDDVPLLTQSAERIATSIPKAHYKLVFLPGGSEYMHRSKPDGAQAEDLEPLVAARQAANDKVAANFVNNTPWMNGLDPAQVEEVTLKYKEAVAAQPEAVDSGEAMDVEETTT